MSKVFEFNYKLTVEDLMDQYADANITQEEAELIISEMEANEDAFCDRINEELSYTWEWITLERKRKAKERKEGKE